MKFEWKEYKSLCCDGSHHYSEFSLVYGEKKCGHYLQEFEYNGHGQPKTKIYRIGLFDNPVYDENKIRLEVIRRYRERLDKEEAALSEFAYKHCESFELKPTI